MLSILAMDVHKRSLRLNYYRRFKFGFCPDFFEKMCKLLDWKGENGEIGVLGLKTATQPWSIFWTRVTAKKTRISA